MIQMIELPPLNKTPKLADAKFLRRLLIGTIALATFAIGGGIWAQSPAYFKAAALDRDLDQYLAQDDDLDGLTNQQELEYGTSATNPDTDEDGILDATELLNGLNPLDKSDVHADPDGDGLDNLLEVTLGSDPNTFTEQVETQ